MEQKQETVKTYTPKKPWIKVIPAVLTALAAAAAALFFILKMDNYFLAVMSAAAILFISRLIVWLIKRRDQKREQYVDEPEKIDEKEAVRIMQMSAQTKAESKFW